MDGIFDLTNFLARCYVPNMQLAAMAARRQRLSVRRERDIPHPVRMARQRKLFLPAGSIPDLNQPIIPGRRKCLSVRRIGHRSKGLGVSLEIINGLMSFGIPFSYMIIKA